MQRKPMSKIVQEAKKRRAKYLVEFNKKSQSIADFARSKDIDPTRMGQLLKKAKDDAKNEC